MLFGMILCLLFIQQIHSYVISELNRFENEISEGFAALKNDLELRQVKPAIISTAKLV